MMDSTGSAVSNTAWAELCSYVSENKAVVFGKGFSVSETPRGFVLKSHWARWVFVFVLIVITLIHWFPAIASFFMPVKKTIPLQDLVLFALFGIFWLLALVKILLPVGTVKWIRETGSVEIHYGTLIRRRRVIVQKHDLTLHIYRYKGDRPAIQARYHSIVLSLTYKQAPEAEILLTSVSRKRSISVIQTIYEKLHSEQDIQISPDIAAALQQKKENVFPDTLNAGWLKLAESSQIKGAFLFRANPLIIRKTADGVRIKNSKILFFGIFFFLLATFFTIISFDAVKEQEPFFTVFMLICILFTFTIGYMHFALEYILFLKNNGNSIHFATRCFPFFKEFSYEKDKLQVYLYKCDFDHANWVKRPGQVILSLIHRDYPETELVLATADTEYKLLPAYEKITAFLGNGVKRGLTEEYKFYDGTRATLPATALSGGDIYTIERSLSIVSEDLCVLKSTGSYAYLFFGNLLIGMFVFLYFSFQEPGDKISEKILGFIVIFGIGGFTMLWGAVLSLQYLVHRYIIADKRSGSFYYRPFLHRIWRQKEFACLNEIRAIQLCSIFTTVLRGKAKQKAIYEINLILNGPDSKRITLSCGGKYEQICTDAATLAEFLQVPLLNMILTNEK